MGYFHTQEARSFGSPLARVGVPQLALHTSKDVDSEIDNLCQIEHVAQKLEVFRSISSLSDITDSPPLNHPGGLDANPLGALQHDTLELFVSERPQPV